MSPMGEPSLTPDFPADELHIDDGLAGVHTLLPHLRPPERLGLIGDLVEWARLLGINIIESIVNGTDVSKALDDILSELKEIKSIIEKDRRANNEAFTLVKFIVPAVYILSVYGANKFFGFTLDKFFSYQFTTALGIKFFMAIIFLSAISFVAMFILKKPKFDY